MAKSRTKTATEPKPTPITHLPMPYFPEDWDHEEKFTCGRCGKVLPVEESNEACSVRGM